VYEACAAAGREEAFATVGASVADDDDGDGAACRGADAADGGVAAPGALLGNLRAPSLATFEPDAPIVLYTKDGSSFVK